MSFTYDRLGRCFRFVYICVCIAAFFCVATISWRIKIYIFVRAACSIDRLAKYDLLLVSSAKFNSNFERPTYISILLQFSYLTFSALLFVLRVRLDNNNL